MKRPMIDSSAVEKELKSVQLALRVFGSKRESGSFASDHEISGMLHALVSQYDASRFLGAAGDRATLLTQISAVSIYAAASTKSERMGW